MEERHLYPMKFSPIFKETIWGGNQIKNKLNKEQAGDTTGESWEISAVKDNISIVSNGFLAGNALTELIEIYMDELVGQKVFDQHGSHFPLLIKFIDAQSNLSIQVHPNDELAQERHHSAGKTEMWYVLDSDPGAQLISGFTSNTDKETYLRCLQEGSLHKLLHSEEVQAGDVFFIPAGRIHAIGAGILLAEIQQTSDVTYRIYDYKRKDKDGNERELHTALALDVIDFDTAESYKTSYSPIVNESVPCVNSAYFTTRVLTLDQVIERDYNNLDSFVIYICTEGSLTLHYEQGTPLALQKGETILLPAVIHAVRLEPDTQTTLLEVYID